MSDSWEEVIRKVIKREAAKMIPDGLELGKVVQKDPLQIVIGGTTLPLNLNNLLISKHLLDNTRKISFRNIDVEMKYPDSNVNRDMSTNQSLVLIHNCLEVNDLVLLQGINNGQKYILIDVLIDGKTLVTK